MSGNPIQRKSNNAFLLGMLIMLIIAVIIGAVLYMFVLKDTSIIGNKNEKEVYAYKLTQNVKSGDELQETAITKVKLLSSEVPSNYLNATMEKIPVGSYAKVDLGAGTILTNSLLGINEEKTNDEDNTLRLAEFNMITLPSTLSVGDYIDVRLLLPTGQDFIVISKKRVMSINETTIGLNLNEKEIITMNCAIVDSYIMTASNIYAIQYTEPGLQKEAIPTYPVNIAVYDLAITNPNITSEIKNMIKSRYDENGGQESTIRKTFINPELEKYMNRSTLENEPYLEDVEIKVQEQIKKAQELYLSGLQGY